jgi:hypothetical protein
VEGRIRKLGDDAISSRYQNYAIGSLRFHAAASKIVDLP